MNWKKTAINGNELWERTEKKRKEEAKPRTERYQQGRTKK